MEVEKDLRRVGEKAERVRRCVLEEKCRRKTVGDGRSTEVRSRVCKTENEAGDEKEEERVSGWFIESLSGARWICAERKAQAEGRLYSFQAQKLNLISNINLFSLYSLLCTALFLSSRSFPSVCRAPAAGVLPIPHRARRAYIIPARLRIMFFTFPINVTRHNDLRSAVQPASDHFVALRFRYRYNYGSNNMLSLKKSLV